MLKINARLRAILTLSILLLSRFTVAGGNLENIDITGREPSSIAGQVVAKVVKQKWDPRCIPVQYKINGAFDPIPNPLGEPVLTLNEARETIQSAMSEWNKIPTSFIEMNVQGVNETDKLPGYDFVNEQSFVVPEGARFIGASPSTVLMEDTQFKDGQDLDNDGDPDVSSNLSACSDADGDGDIEFPEGFYTAGTILDNDVMYNVKKYRFTHKDEEIDHEMYSADLKAIATHELGHSLGLSHTPNNQQSSDNGTADTMFPFLDTRDRRSERTQRSLESDDIAFASFLYPEGTALSGPATLQDDDVAFSSAYGLLSGEIFHGMQNIPLAGAHVIAIDSETRLRVASAVSGTVQLSFDPATEQLDTAARDVSLVNGKFVIPVPKGKYFVRVEPIDGAPVNASAINITADTGARFRLQDFTEEFYNVQEAAVEERPGVGKTRRVEAGETSEEVRIVTNRTVMMANYGSTDNAGFIDSPAGSYYAVAFPAQQFTDADSGAGLAIQAGLFRTIPVQPSTVPKFAEAILTTCELSDDGSAKINLEGPLRRRNGFNGQDNDMATYFFPRPVELGGEVLAMISENRINHLCLVLRLPFGPFPGDLGKPPLIGLDGGRDITNDAPIHGLSFVSTDGQIFHKRDDVNFQFALQVTDLAEKLAVNGEVIFQE